MTVKETIPQRLDRIEERQGRIERKLDVLIGCWNGNPEARAVATDTDGNVVADRTRPVE